MQEIKKINLSLEFETIKISHFVDDMKNGGTPRRNVSKYWENGTIPWLKTGEINNSPILDNSEYITEEGLKKSSAKVLPINSVIMALYGKGTAGRVGLLKFEATTNQACCAMICKDRIKSEYLYYYLLSIQPQIELLANGSVQQNLSKEILADYDINVPKNYQDLKNIVWILKNIDQKIENNKSINKNLEKTLITIFNSWFINFENYDNSKGMKIDESYGEIPVDWSVEMLEDYVDFVTGVEPGSKNYHEKPEPHDIPFLRVGDLGSRDNGVFIDPSLSKNKILKYDDIVLSLDATIGIVKMGLEGAYSTGMRKLVIKNDNINQPFLYCLVKSNRIQRIIETFATGTTILHAGKSIKHMNFVLSDKKTMDDFGKIGNPIISIILTNLKEIEYLTNLRDTLLPKLMSGEIDVSKINCDLELKYNYMKYLFNQIHTPMSKSVV